MDEKVHFPRPQSISATAGASIPRTPDGAKAQIPGGHSGGYA